jgi:hypothetical protein
MSKRSFQKCSDEIALAPVASKKSCCTPKDDVGRALVETAVYWEKKFLAYKKRNKGGTIPIQHLYCAPSLASSLWNTLSPKVKNYERIELNGKDIEKFNVFFGEGEYEKAGWCFESYPKRQETWKVDRVLVNYSVTTGKLDMHFDTSKAPWTNVSFTFRDSLTIEAKLKGKRGKQGKK